MEICLEVRANIGSNRGDGVRAEGGTMIQYVLFSLVSIPGTKKTRKKETNTRVSRQRSLTKEYKTFLSSFYSRNQKKTRGNKQKKRMQEFQRNLLKLYLIRTLFYGPDIHNNYRRVLCEFIFFGRSISCTREKRR